jgi:hypothetical protein
MKLGGALPPGLDIRDSFWSFHKTKIEITDFIQTFTFLKSLKVSL